MSVYISERDRWDGKIDGFDIAEEVPPRDEEWKYDIFGPDYWDIISDIGYTWTDFNTINNVYTSFYITPKGDWVTDYRPSMVRLYIDKTRLPSNFTIDVLDIESNKIGSAIVTSSGDIDIQLNAYDNDIGSIRFVFTVGTSINYINIETISFYTEETPFMYLMWDGVIPEDMYEDHLYASYYGKIDISNIKTDYNDFAYSTIQLDNEPIDVYIDENREVIKDFDGNIVKVGDLLEYDSRLVKDRDGYIYLNYAPTYRLKPNSDPEYVYYYGYEVDEFENYVDPFGNTVFTEDGLSIDRNDLLVFRNSVMTDENGDVYLLSKYKIRLFKLDNYGAGLYWYKKYDYKNYPFYHPSYNEVGSILSTAYQVNLDLSTQPYNTDDIISESISKNLHYLWEFIRPAHRNSDYNFILGPEVDLTGNEYSLYDGMYSDMCVSRATKASEPLDDAHIEIFLDNIDSWTVGHGLGLNVIVRCYDISFAEIVPISIKLSENNAYIKFDRPINGIVLIKKARATGLDSVGEVSDFIHNTGKKYAVTQFYDNSYVSVTPKDVYSPNPSNVNEIEILKTSMTYGYGLYPQQNKIVYISSGDIRTSSNLEHYPYWKVKHNLGYLAVIVDCYDNNGRKIKPLGVKFVSINETLVYFNFDEISGDGSTAVVTPIGDINSIQGPIVRNPDGSLYHYEWKLGFYLEKEDRRILSEDRYTETSYNLSYDEESEREIFYLDNTYTGRILKAEEDNDWVYYTFKIPKEGDINIQEIGLFNDESPIVERQNVTYTRCRGIYKPDGVSMYVIYKVYKDPDGLDISEEPTQIDFVVEPGEDEEVEAQYLIDSDNVYVLDYEDKRIRTD